MERNRPTRRSLLRTTGTIGATGVVGSLLANSASANQQSSSQEDVVWVRDYHDKTLEEEQHGLRGTNKYRMEHSLSVAYNGSEYDGVEEKHQHKYSITSVLASRFDDYNTDEGYIEAGWLNWLSDHELTIDVNDADMELWVPRDFDNFGVYPATGPEPDYGVARRAVMTGIGAAVSKIHPVIGLGWTAAEIMGVFSASSSKEDVNENEATIGGYIEDSQSHNSFLYLEITLYSDAPCQRDPFEIRSTGKTERQASGEGTSHDITISTPRQVPRNMC